ncbi:MAG: PilZ domain-containing protein [Candidatus Sulfotelmatobacter sp.]
MDAENQPVETFRQGMADARRDPRFRVDVDIRIDSRASGVVMGRTVDISESGIAAMLKLEVPLGEFVELQFTLPFGPVRVYATVRQRNAFRYGFQFVESHSAHEIIQATCRHLKLEQSLRRAR